jgi:hypothetical protein
MPPRTGPGLDRHGEPAAHRADQLGIGTGIGGPGIGAAADQLEVRSSIRSRIADSARFSPLRRKWSCPRARCRGQ